MVAIEKATVLKRPSIVEATERSMLPCERREAAKTLAFVIEVPLLEYECGGLGLVVSGVCCDMPPIP